MHTVFTCHLIYIRQQMTKKEVRNMEMMENSNNEIFKVCVKAYLLWCALRRQGLNSTKLYMTSNLSVVILHHVKYVDDTTVLSI